MCLAIRHHSVGSKRVQNKNTSWTPFLSNSHITIGWRRTIRQSLTNRACSCLALSRFTREAAEILGILDIIFLAKAAALDAQQNLVT